MTEESNLKKDVYLVADDLTLTKRDSQADSSYWDSNSNPDLTDFFGKASERLNVFIKTAEGNIEKLNALSKESKDIITESKDSIIYFTQISKDLKEDIKDQKAIVYLGFIFLLVMIAAMILDAFRWNGAQFYELNSNILELQNKLKI